MEQMMERLLAKIYANQTKADTDREHMQEMLARMDANTKEILVKMDHNTKERMDANANAMQKRWPPTEEKEYRKQEPAKKA
jgi:hypothetical protein